MKTVEELRAEYEAALAHWEEVRFRGNRKQLSEAWKALDETENAWRLAYLPQR